MGKPTRRDFLKLSSFLAGGAIGLHPEKADSNQVNIRSEDRMGVLVDTTYCIGCRKCEYACKVNHDLPANSIQSFDDRSVFNQNRRPDATSLTIVNEYTNDDIPGSATDVKFQCMHCDQPACVSACIVGAFSKLADGSVVYDKDRCIGCRYCMIACPFQIPAYEYSNPLTPQIQKCDFCYDRTAQGQLPACVEMCPAEALIYGKSWELLQVARERIKKNPEQYNDHIFGETEVGGTSWLYLADRKFSDIGFPKLGNDPAPGVSESIQHGIFAYFIPPLALYSLLGGIMWLNKNFKSESEE